MEKGERGRGKGIKEGKENGREGGRSKEGGTGEQGTKGERGERCRGRMQVIIENRYL